jgi:eukaryotic-like serine/threonine-protein kinase
MGSDGHSVLYLAGAVYAKPWERKLMRVPVEGGTPEEIPIGGWADEFRCALGTGKRCVLRTSIQKECYVFYDLDPIRGKGRELARTKWVPEYVGDWDISPDGTEVAIPNHDPHNGRIRVITLQESSQGSSEREIVLPDRTDLRGLVWAADGRGWFVTIGYDSWQSIAVRVA